MILKRGEILMQFSLDDEQTAEIKTLVFSIVKEGIRQVTSTRPYVNRKEIARYFGVAESTIRKWTQLGMPVALIDGRKLYGKQSITNWLKQHETPAESSCQHKQHTKKPVTIAVVTSK